MEIQRKCQWCGKPFIAHTMVTRYCSKSCNEKAYKEKKRKQRLQEYEERQNEQPMQEVGIVGSKLYLSPAEAATLLGISRATIYRHMAVGIIRALQLRGRTKLNSWRVLTKLSNFFVLERCSTINAAPRNSSNKFGFSLGLQLMLCPFVTVAFVMLFCHFRLMGC